MIEIKITNKDNLCLATFLREGKEKCTIDYNAMRLQLMRDWGDPQKNKDFRDYLIGQFLWVLEDGFSKKLDKKEMQTLQDFLEAIETGKEEFQAERKD